VSVDHSITQSVLQLVCLCLKKREDLSFIAQGSVLTEGVCFLQIEGESEFEREKNPSVVMVGPLLRLRKTMLVVWCCLSLPFM
jgi:hypothetical protein